MAQAIAGEESSSVYSYMVNAKVNEVKGYYSEALPKLGLTIWAEGSGQVDTIMLFYRNETLSGAIMIVNQVDVTIVLLTQS
jgi:hypothetical protein